MATTSQHGTLTGGAVTTVTLTGNKRGFRVQHATAGVADIWWTWGYDSAVDPATDGSVDGSYRLPAGVTDKMDDPVERDNETQIVVKLKSTGTPAYSVESW